MGPRRFFRHKVSSPNAPRTVAVPASSGKGALRRHFEREQRAFFPDLLVPAGLRAARFRASGRQMAEHRRIWPLLVYGGLAAIAAARREKSTRPNLPRRSTLTSGSASLTGHSIPLQMTSQRNFERIAFGAAGRSRQEAAGAGRERPADLRASAPREGAGQGATRRAPWQIPWAGWKDILLARLCEH